MENQIKRNWLAICLLAGFGVIGLVLVCYVVAVVGKQLALKQAVNDLKWVGLALHQYHDKYGSFPPVVVRDGKGIPLHSWRAIVQPQFALPGLTQERFPDYDFTRPWNHQLPVASPLLQRFDHPMYQFLAVVGPQSAWTDGRSRNLSEITDGTSHTLLLVGLRNTGVRWHQPTDLIVKNKTLFLGDRPVDLTHDVFVLTADGATRYYGNGIDREALAGMLTIAANDPVPEW